MAAGKQDRNSVEALEKELQELERRLEKAKRDQETNAETLVNKLRRGMEAARKKERAAEEKLAKIKNKKKTEAQQRQLHTAHQSLADARARTLALTQEMAEAQEAHQGFRSNTARQAERARVIARETAAYDQRRKRTGGTTRGRDEQVRGRNTPR